MFGHALVLHVVLSWNGAQYISQVFGCSVPGVRVTGSLLFAAPVRGGIVLCLPQVLIEFLWWTVVIVSRILSGTW